MLAYDFAKYMFNPVAGTMVYIPFLTGAVFFILVQYYQLNAVWGILFAIAAGALFLRG